LICDALKIHVVDLVHGLDEPDPVFHSWKLSPAAERKSEDRPPTTVEGLSPPAYHTQPRAKIWFLKGPDGVSYRVENIAKWVQKNSRLFDPADVVPRYNEDSSSNAAAGLRRLRPTLLVSRKEWNGWIWDYDAERAEKDHQK
jgi:hypothetical protein